MAIKVLTNVEGSAHTEYELVVPDSEPLAFAPGAITASSNLLFESVYQNSRYIHKFTTQSVDYVNKFLRKASFSGIPQLRFRFGIGQAGQIAWQPWQLHRITNPAAVPEGVGRTAGHFLELTTEDGIYALGLTTKILARRGTVSSIVQQIASENQIRDVVIEPTVGELAMIQASLDDASFVRRRLIRRATNSKGRGNYLFYMRDGVLHFHTPDYQGQAYELEYYRANGASITQNDNSQMMIEHGAAGVFVITYNPLTGETREVVAAPDRALRFANVIPDYSTVPGAQINVPYHHSINGVEEAVSIAQNTYENARMQCFKLSMELDKIVFHAGDIVRVILAPAADKTTPWSGLWFVAEASHNIVKNAIRSTYVMQRGELLNLLGGQKTVADGQRALRSEQEAPGQDVNLAEFGSSQLTKGAGSQAASKTFSVVRDPNKVR